MSEELKSCPFCGGKAEMSQPGTRHHAPHPQSHEARLIAARRFIEADAVLTQAMRDGINFHGAVSGMVAAEDELRAAMSEHPAGVKTGAPERETADNWQQYAREGETAQACIERHRREQDYLLKLLAQAREPLTDQQIIALLPDGWTGMLAQVMEFARRIERARTAGVRDTAGGSANG